MEFENYSKSDIAAVCLHWGPILDHWLVGTNDGTGKPILGPQLMYAISGCESSFGANCKPRYEKAYDELGKYCDEKLFEQYGHDSAYSYGPWQVMLTNAPGFSPKELACDLEKAATATVGFIHRFVLVGRKAITLEEVLDTYNSGTWRDAQSDDVKAYIAKGTHYYFNEAASVAGGGHSG